MREEITRALGEAYDAERWAMPDSRHRGFHYRRAGEVMFIMRTKIEAVGNPYMDEAELEAFECCRREVVALFGEGE